MCGIAGILNLRMEAPHVGEPLLNRMRDSMTHRGPDSAGHWISLSRNVGLAHRRLSIIDLSTAAQQPMGNEDGSHWIVFNGEIYNHLKLRRELESMGHQFKSHSDTECILHGYEEWGHEVVERIDGMFALAIWDNPRKQLWLARDRLGKKPLYFTEIQGQFLFASEIKALLEHPGIVRKINEEALWHYLTFASTPAPLTLFDRIYKLPPATHLSVPVAGPWTFTEYWRPWSPTDSPVRTMEEYALETRTWLQDAVERRLMSDVPFGVFLSGGVDSSANVAIMSQLLNRPVNTFSVGFKDRAQNPYNEIHHARRVSQLFKTNHHEILIDDSHFFGMVDSLAFHQDEPLADPVCVPLYHLSKLAREKGTVVIQVGEGSDELFAGYDIYRNYLQRQNLYWKHFQKLPGGIQNMAAKAGKLFLRPRQATQLQRASQGEPVFITAALAFHDAEKAGLYPWSTPASSGFLSARAYTGVNPSFDIISRIFTGSMIRVLPPFHPENLPNGKTDFLKLMINWECHQRLAELLLMRLDKMMMAHGVEGRAPFLDTQMVRLSMQIPSAFKIYRGSGKAVLKKALEPLLPHDLIYRKKIGFCGGSHNMLTPGILDFARDLILKTLPDHGWNKPALHLLLSNQEKKKSENSFQIWNLMNLSLWIKKWL